MVQKRLRIFACFGHLPKELRDYIWELAIQNDKDEAAIHFFCAMSNLETFQVDLDVNLNDARWRKRKEYLKAPTWKSHGGLEDWASHKNPSGYLLDPGLWFACTESRASMARKRQRDPYHCASCVKLPAKKGSWQRHIAIWSDRDLIIFQLPTSRILSLPLGILEGLTKSSFWQYLPFCGIEYDPQWGMRFGEGDEEGRSTVDLYSRKTDPFSRLLWEIVDFSTTQSAITELWLVDHQTLRPAAGMTCAELGKDRITFKARGWRYFEVRPGDLGTRWKVAEGFTWWQTPWYFTWKVESHADHIEWLDLANVGRDSVSRFQMMSWSVAACIKDE